MTSLTHDQVQQFMGYGFVRLDHAFPRTLAEASCESFAGADSNPNDFSSWRVNINSRGRALLMLFLFSDVGEQDAPARIRVGSHLEVAKILEAAGEFACRTCDSRRTRLAIIDIDGNKPRFAASATAAKRRLQLAHAGVKRRRPS